MTEKSRPYILISNDDGYTAKGINFLVDTLKPMADLLVVAPDSPRSGAGCSITAAHPLSYKPVRREPGLHIYACTGTPTDCVKMAINCLAERRPDLVIGGINHGDNSSVNSHYSGTMGVATEGALHGITSLAFSLCDHSPEADFTPLREYLIHFTRYALTHPLPPYTCLNINFPRQQAFGGIRICRMAKSRWENELERREHPWGGPYFWLVGDCRELEPEATDTDRWALAHGFVAVTPTQLDVTATDLLRTLLAEMPQLMPCDEAEQVQSDTTPEKPRT